MIYGDAKSSFDLRFRLFGFPVRVSPYFFLISGLIGADIALQPNLGWTYLLLWIGLMFVSILLHELGHALAYRLFGSPAEITLHGFGGYAQGYRLPKPWQRIIVSLAGPVAQLLFAAFVWGSAYFTNWPNPNNNYLKFTFIFLLMMNIYWALFNLMPMLPLDGGNVMREVLAIARLRNPDATAHILSVGVAGLLALRGVAALANFKIPVVDDVLPKWLVPGQFLTFWLILLAIDNAQMYQRFRQRGSRDFYDGGYNDDTPPWRRR
jgi:stage IV sporulation protein FB